jgi:hypothetical protein
MGLLSQRMGASAGWPPLRVRRCHGTGSPYPSDSQEARAATGMFAPDGRCTAGALLWSHAVARVGRR